MDGPLTGTTLGRYRISSKLGEGGMGVVYRAADTELKREVAIKVLPEALTGDADRLARFRREAEVLASLNHPHIATVHGLERDGPLTGLVMELVEGPTLAERIAGGPIPWREVVPLACQIAEALEAAHEQGIVHRDLKPANVKIRGDGVVKVLDFGLAKALDPAPGGWNTTHAPTITSPAMTAAGVIIGTAAYMSPEQATGRSVDKRADIWSFGTVVWEMLTGTRLFEGETVGHTLADVLRAPIELGGLPADTPGAIRNLLARCLQRDAKARLRDIGEARIVLSGSLESAATVEANSVSPWRLHAAWAGALLVAAIVTWYVSSPNAPARPAANPIRFSIAAPTGSVSLPQGRAMTQDAISPDGRRLALAVSVAGRILIAVQTFESDTSTILAGTDGARMPFWSPDSRFIGFFAQGKLKRIDADGGTPQVVCDAPLGEGGTWNADGTIVFAPRGAGELFSVPAGGGEPVPVTRLDATKKEESHRYPWFLPDGRHFLFFSAPSTIAVGSLDSMDRVELTSADSKAQFAEGLLLFSRNGALLAQRFDPERLALSGEPIGVDENVADSASVNPSGDAAFHASGTGMLVTRRRFADAGRSQLVWVDRTGKELSRLGEREDQTGIEISPDGRRVAASLLDSTRRTRDVWIYEVARNTKSRFTFDPADDFNPIWSPDGSHITWNSSRGGQFDLYQKLASGAGTDELILKDQFSKFPWTHNSLGLITYWKSGVAENALSVFDLRAREAKAFATEERTSGYGHMSPDGRWILYEGAASELGRTQVFVVPYPNRGGKWQVTADGGTRARWRADGKEIFFISNNNELMAAAIQASDTAFSVEPARRLFELQARSSGYGRYGSYNYDVSPDGQRFLINQALDVDKGLLPTIVTNWTATLSR